MADIFKFYTPKQIQVLKTLWTTDWFICGLHGAKRSGKTVVNNDVFITELERVRMLADKLGIDEPMYILAGTSSTSIQNNVLQELYNKYGFEPKYDKHGSFLFRGVKVVLVYTGSISGLKRARGFTAYGAYINEASLANEDVFKEVVSRCSGEGARVVWDSNPDNPNHWLKRDYIDSDDEQIIDFHFKLDDNTFLSKRYIENIKAATPSGKFYDRDILGIWSFAEGSVYRDFDDKMYVSVSDIDNIELKTIFAGIDWGYEHHGSIVVCAETTDGGYYLLEEYSHQYKEIDFWVEIAREIKSKYGNIVFYADSARPEHVYRMQREGVKCVNANKSVLSGIEQVAKLMKTSRFFVVKEKVSRFNDEIYRYVWNEKTGEPIKMYDDVLDALRYAIYTYTSQQKTIIADKKLFGFY